ATLWHLYKPENRGGMIGFHSASDYTRVVDEKMAERARSGDVEAVGELIRSHREQALVWAHSMVGEQHKVWPCYIPFLVTKSPILSQSPPYLFSVVIFPQL